MREDYLRRREYFKEYYRKHKDKYKKDPEAQRAYNREYYQAHKEKWQQKYTPRAKAKQEAKK